MNRRGFSAAMARKDRLPRMEPMRARAAPPRARREVRAWLQRFLVE